MFLDPKACSTWFLQSCLFSLISFVWLQRLDFRQTKHVLRHWMTTPSLYTQPWSGIPQSLYSTIEWHPSFCTQSLSSTPVSVLNHWAAPPDSCHLEKQKSKNWSKESEVILLFFATQILRPAEVLPPLSRRRGSSGINSFPLFWPSHYDFSVTAVRPQSCHGYLCSTKTRLEPDLSHPSASLLPLAHWRQGWLVPKTKAIKQVHSI